MAANLHATITFRKQHAGGNCIGGSCSSISMHIKPDCCAQNGAGSHRKLRDQGQQTVANAVSLWARVSQSSTRQFHARASHTIADSVPKHMHTDTLQSSIPACTLHQGACLRKGSSYIVPTPQPLTAAAARRSLLPATHKVGGIQQPTTACKPSNPCDPTPPSKTASNPIRHSQAEQPAKHVRKSNKTRHHCPVHGLGP